MAGSFLRQSTASQSRATPPFLDDTDFKTAETGLTIANTDVKIIVNGGASADKNSGGGTHRANGVYGLTFDATDTATVGEMEVSIKVAGALPVFMKFWVLEEAVYDALFAASAPGYVANAPVNVAQFGGTNGTFASGIPAVNATQLSGSATAADNAEVVFATDFPTNYDTTLDLWNVNIQKVGGASATVAGTVDANVTAISGDSVAADNAEAFFDGTGYATAQNAIATSLLDLSNGVESGVTLRQAMRLIAAAVGGVLSGAATTTVTIKAAANSGTTRVTATVDSDGNRSALTLNL